VEVAAGPYEADFGEERFLVDKLVEGNECKLELAGDTDHMRVEVFLDERAKRSDAELGAEHDVESVRAGAARLVAELYSGDLAFFNKGWLSRLLPTSSLLLQNIQ